MRKLFAIILAVLMLTGITLTGYAETGIPHDTGAAIGFKQAAAMYVANQIKQNATGGNGSSTWPSWTWKVEFPNQGDREIWLDWSHQTGKESMGRLGVMIRKSTGVFYAYMLINAPEHIQVSATDDQTIPSDYMRTLAETNGFPGRYQNDVQTSESGASESRLWLCGEIVANKYIEGTGPWANLQSNIEDARNSSLYEETAAELCYIIDAWQYVLTPDYVIGNLGFATINHLCRFHVWDEGTVILEPTVHSTGMIRYICTRNCGAARLSIIPKLPFDDVPPTSYYAGAVDWATENGITSGNGETTFGPTKKCTRAQIVTMLWRAAGSPEAEGENYFADVSETAYYAPAVAWAYENGITKGAGDGCFGPNAPCTRAQIVTMLWRANGSPEEEAPARFADVRKGAWYAPAVHWAAGNGVTTGTGSGEFSPNVICTRAQVVTMLWKNGGEG